MSLTASLFILINSISGILGQLTKENILNEICPIHLYFLQYWLVVFLEINFFYNLSNYINISFSNRILALIINPLLVIFVAVRIWVKNIYSIMNLDFLKSLLDGGMGQELLEDS